MNEDTGVKEEMKTLEGKDKWQHSIWYKPHAYCLWGLSCDLQKIWENLEEFLSERKKTMCQMANEKFFPSDKVL